MKKLFLLIPVLMLSLVVNAAVININTETSDALRKALNSASSGDIIEMAAGTYVESAENFIAFSGKDVTVRAASGATVILQPKVPITISGGAKATLKGIKIDASHLHDTNTWYEHIIYATDASDNNILDMEGCELYGFNINNSAIFCGSSNKIDSVIINNCYFHNITKCCIFLENTTTQGLIITNSTFTDFETESSSYYASPIANRTATGKWVVDHCTFYDVKAMNTDYGIIGRNGTTTTDVLVSNCIFAWSTEYDKRATYLPSGTNVKNCIVYNTNKDTNYWGHHSGPTFTACSMANPLFTDAANADFSFDNTSPAYFTGTNWTHIGAPEWFPTEPDGIDLPAASADAAVALNNTNIEAKHAAVTYGDGYYDMTYASDIRWTAWVVNINPLMYNLSACVSCTTYWHPDLYLYDLTTGEEIASRIEESHASTEGASFDLGEWDLTSVETGKYLLVVKNNYSGSTLKLQSLTLSYLGGAVQDISSSVNTTLNVADALFSSNGTRADGKITFPGSTIQDGWVKWNVAFATAGSYNVTLNVNSDNCKNYTVALYADEEAEPVASVSLNDCGTKGSPVALALGSMIVPAGNYVLKVVNSTVNSDAELISVVLAFAGGAVNDIPGTITLSDAMRSTRAYIEDGALHFTDASHLSTISGEWAKWNIHAGADGVYTFTANCNSTNSSRLKITLYDDEDNELYSHQTKYSFSTATTVTTPSWYLEAGDYVLKLENPANHSNGYVTALSAAAAANLVTLDEAATTNSDWSAKVDDGNSYTVRIIRTIKAGMYNTFCLPFAVSSSQCKDIFGSDVELRTLDEATVEDAVLTLDFKTASDIYQGTPVLIKPSRDIVNPVFEGVVFISATPATSTATNANFVGTFVKSELTADPNILFLGANNTLYFPTATIDILGMRAYFMVHDAPANAIKRARIVESGQVATEIELVNTSQPAAKNRKMLLNGQLVIIWDGVQYNAMGARLK